MPIHIQEHDDDVIKHQSSESARLHSKAYIRLLVIHGLCYTVRNWKIDDHTHHRETEAYRKKRDWLSEDPHRDTPTK